MGQDGDSCRDNEHEIGDKEQAKKALIKAILPILRLSLNEQGTRTIP